MTADPRIGGLDGIRGVCTLFVAYAHLGLWGCGWVAMECFFVLSGFLITRILIQDRARAPNFGEYLKRFYVRRALRLFPVLYLYLTLVLLFSPLIPPEQNVAEQVPYAALYVFNLWILTDAHTGTPMLDHLWSLAVEEQFYLMWPLLLGLVPTRHIPKLLVSLLLLAPLTRWLVADYWPQSTQDGLIDNPYLATYFLTSSHLDAFAFGALLNFVRFNARGWHLLLALSATLAAGVLASGWGIRPYVPGGDLFNFGWPMSIPKNYQSVWGYSLIAFDCALLIAVASRPGLLQRAMTWKPLVFMGERSYGFYVFHYAVMALFWPLREWIMDWSGSRSFAAAAISPLYLMLIFFIAHLLHEYVEKPTFRLKNRFSFLAPASGAAARVSKHDPLP